MLDCSSVLPCLQFTGENIVRTKTQQQLLCKLPASDTPFVETWLHTMRPLLTRNQVRLVVFVHASPVAHAPCFWVCAQQGFFFVKRDGSGPRGDIAYCARQIMQRYLNTSVSPHVFRAMQVRLRACRCAFVRLALSRSLVLTAALSMSKATESKEAGISPPEHKAMCAGRQHSTATCERFYERRNLKR